MKSGSIGYLLVGVISGLILGFILANGFSRAESENRRLANTAVKSAPATSPQIQTSDNTDRRETLSPDELRQAIAKADAEPQNLELQRNLGLALYRYAGMEQNSALLVDAVRLLERAAPKVSAADNEFFGTLGNAQFIMARRGEPQRMVQARAAYQQMLKSDPKNVDVLVDIGLTYFFDTPAQPQQALQFYSQALAVNSTHEGALENSIIAFIKLDKGSEAAAALEKLKAANPNNAALSDLQIQVAQLEIAK